MKNLYLPLALAVIIAVAGFGFPYWTAETVTITIEDKERVLQRSGDDLTAKYLVFTETETFQNTDCLIRFKFNASDLQGSLKRGETYEVLVYGWRIPFLSVYRNLVKKVN
jgi:hypothetical protein